MRWPSRQLHMGRYQYRCTGMRMRSCGSVSMVATLVGLALSRVASVECVSSSTRVVSAFSLGAGRRCCFVDPNQGSGWSTVSRQMSSSASTEELPMDLPRREDVMVAVEAVRKACRITRAIQPSGKEDDGISTVTKVDASPVTVGDFCAQAVTLRHLNQNFPQDAFVAEEGSAALRSDPDLSHEILNAIQSQLPKETDSISSLLDNIDLGQSFSLPKHKNTKRIWCLDPIDGTKGFLRGKLTGGQYCVALALIEDGVPVVGILGCPNLPVEVDDDGYAWDEAENEATNGETRGCLFVASRGGGCYQLPLFSSGDTPAKRLHVTPNDGSAMSTSEARFCIGVERSFGDPLGQSMAIAKILHGEDEALDGEGQIIRARRMDSQVKYGVLARGGAEIYIRLPKAGYVEYKWDHAAGSVVIQEAGGEMTNVDGRPIDFGLYGNKLSDTVRGVIGSNGGIFHKALVGAYQQQEKERNNIS
eukprot:scaffold200192_cov51-Attheya_sp.AAC.2